MHTRFWMLLLAVTLPAGLVVAEDTKDTEAIEAATKDTEAIEAATKAAEPETEAAEPEKKVETKAVEPRDPVDDGWEFISDDDGVKVYNKDVDTSEFRAFKGITVIDAPLPRVLHVICENDHRPEWVDRLDKSVILEQNSPHDYVVYQHFGLPIIMSDRDYVYRGIATRDASGMVTLSMSSVEHDKAPEPDGIRADLQLSRYTLTAQGNKTLVTVEIVTDPKGWLPVWFANIIQKTWPRKTLNGIRDQVKKDHVKDYPLPPIGPAPGARPPKADDRS